MRTTVVCGLLGSGKTTFIQGYLAGGSERCVVLVNDFGAAGIDGEVFSAGGVEAVELPSGCVCCTLRFDLITTLRRVIAEFAPAHLVIEPSGVASPEGVLEALASAGVPPATVVGVVDATEFAELLGSGMYGSFFEEQVRRADLVLVNKTDLAGEEASAAAERLVASLNPAAVVLRTVRCALPESGLPELTAGGGARTPGAGGAPRPHQCFETLSFRLPAPVSAERLRGFLDDLAAGRYGAVARAKALVQTGAGPLRCDVASGRPAVEPFARDVADSRLVVIGTALARAEIAAALATLAL